MPLLLTPATAFQNDALLDVPTAYAIIERVAYSTREKIIEYHVGYYASEAAFLDRAAALRVNALPTGFVQPATPEQANAVPIFQFLESALTQQLTQLLGALVRIENVA